MNFILGVNHPVRDPEGAARLLIDYFGFSPGSHPEEQGPRLRLVENGALTLRLLRSDQPSDWLRLDAGCEDLDTSIEAARGQGFEPQGQRQWVSSSREQQELRGPHQLILTLFHEYSEDELDILPPLPAQMPWAEEADQLVRELLRVVPLAFRASARERAVRTAEADAVVAGQTRVSRHQALTSLLRVTPDFQHHTLRDQLEQRGLRWQDYWPTED